MVIAVVIARAKLSLFTISLKSRFCFVSFFVALAVVGGDVRQPFPLLLSLSILILIWT
jgi:hypothetical protein